MAKTGKAKSVHRSVEYHRGAGTIQGDRMHKRTDLPLATGDRFDESLAAMSPTAKARQIGLQAGFIKENQPLWINLILTGSPVTTLLCYVRTILLTGA